MFVAIHFFLYPASNGYNSYFDKDEGPIGGLKNPPKVDKELYYWSLAFDVIALLMGFYVSIWVGLGFLVYGLVSKAYSHPSIRLKSKPIVGMLSVALFQGGLIYLTVKQGYFGTELMSLNNLNALGALTATVLLVGSYPMTQIYQHKEDRERGDITLSILLGIKGTFLFTGMVFTASIGLFFWYFKTLDHLNLFLIQAVFLAPTLIFFSYWFWKSQQDVAEVNFENTMRLNLLSSLCLNAFFVFALWY